jgi:hypothetical protein
MISRSHIAASLLLLVLLAQGLLVWHGIDHLIVSDNAECVLCLKTEQQKYGLLNLSYSYQASSFPSDKIPSSILYFEKETSSQFQSRAPPVIS